jgi:imidazoleglycerol-phosphate dehydratase
MRSGKIERNTKETQIALALDLDGGGTASITTGVGFFDHMLDQIARHAPLDLTLSATGDLHIDGHHTVEDVGIAFGQAVDQALSDRKGLTRYGDAHVPLDEALTRVVVDISGRPFFVCDLKFPTQKIGDFDTELVEDFFQAFAANALCNLHVLVHYGRNSHHIAEAIFKSLAKALDYATQLDPRVKGVPSTKGIL